MKQKDVMLRGKVNLILDAIASLGSAKELHDPQLKRILDALRKHVIEYYDPYAVVVRPPEEGDPIDERVTRRRRVARGARRRRSR